MSTEGSGTYTHIRQTPVHYPAGPLSAVVIAAAAVLGAGALAVAPAASADSTMVFVERALTDTPHNIDAKGEDSAGDIMSFNNPVYDASNTNKLGDDEGTCTRTVAGVSWYCAWSLNLGNGQIMVAGPFYDSANSTLAITGGTGQYADARGQMDLTHISPDDSTIRFTYRVVSSAPSGM